MGREGEGLNNTDPTEVFSFRVPRWFGDLLKAKAKRAGKPVSQYIRELISLNSPPEKP
jgi:predicted DNA-binding protein